MDRAVNKLLDRIEQHNNVKILYACESGSRVLGLDSRDADYDPRFIYVHPLNWYLDITDKKPDTIECTDKIGAEPVLHASGWELRKALRLYSKSNTQLMEWLDSSTIYRDIGDLASPLRLWQDDYLEPKSIMWSYWSRVKNDLDNYFKYKNRTSIKYYLYMIRHLLCCRWIELTNKMPPLRFETLVKELLTHSTHSFSYNDKHYTVDELKTLNEEIAKAVVVKQKNIGYMIREEHEVFHNFIMNEFHRIEDVCLNKPRREDRPVPIEPLNDLLRIVVAKEMFVGLY